MKASLTRDNLRMTFRLFVGTGEEREGMLAGCLEATLELCTHTPRKSSNTIDLYTTFLWEALCAEVRKLKVQRHERGQLARLALAASADPPRLA